MEKRQKATKSDIFSIMQEFFMLLSFLFYIALTYGISTSFSYVIP